MADEQRTVVVADTSGSMREHGKAMLVRNLLDHARQAWSWAGGAPPLLVQWSGDVTVLSVLAQDELPPLALGGRAAIQPLITLLEGLAGAGGPIGVVVLSDGHLASADVNAFRAWARRRPNVTVRAIAVGPDAATATLARLVSVAEPSERQGSESADPSARAWFGPQDICSALDAWPAASSVPEPTRIADLTDATDQP